MAIPSHFGLVLAKFTIPASSKRPTTNINGVSFTNAKNVLAIPGIANTFLALVKDTPLIFVVGLLELAGMVNLAKTNPKWLGMAMEGYVFAAIIFWIICYAMSKYSYNLEIKYKTER